MTKEHPAAEAAMGIVTGAPEAISAFKLMHLQGS